MNGELIQDVLRGKHNKVKLQ